MKASFSAKELARCAIFAALEAGLLCLAAVLPTGKLALTAIAGVLTVGVVVSCGKVPALCVYVVAGALSLLIAPGKSCALLYLAFLGYYPILKSIFEHCRRREAEWLLKLAVFNAAFAVVFFLARTLLLSAEAKSIPGAILWLGANVVFVVYDIGLTKLISLLLQRLPGKTGRN